MSPRLRGLAALWGPVILWCGMIFSLSSIPNLRFFRESLIDFIFRKAGHIGEYAILARLLARALKGSTAWSMKKIFAAALTLAILYAASDEFHQTFVRGRMGHSQDVAIDSAGALIGLSIAP